MRQILTKTLLACTAIVLILAGGERANAALITFDDLPDSTAVPNLYGGLNWSNISVLDSSQPVFNPSGYLNGTVSGSNVAFNANAGVATISAPSGTFSFVSGYFAAAWNNGMTLHLTGFNGATPIFTDSLTINATIPTVPLLVTENWSNLTSLQFFADGGTHAPGVIGTGSNVSLDNLQITLDSPPVATPEPTSFACMLIGLAGFALRQRGRRKIVSPASA